MSVPDEMSRLCQQQEEGEVTKPLFRRPTVYWSLSFVLFVLMMIIGRWSVSIHHSTIQNDNKNNNTFPDHFLFGSATSSYQIEGAIDSRGWTVWDTFVRQKNTTLDHSTADRACDHYHRMKADVALMNSLHLQAYRFSISWSRIMPTGTNETISQEGLDFYNQLIDELLQHNITPFVTLFHWDTPQGLQDKFGGWLDERTAHAFADYARVVFDTLGDRVKHWITVNEPWTIAVNGYDTGIHAPGHHYQHSSDNSEDATYRVGHNLLRAHALAVSVYRNEFQSQQKGIIGMAHSGDFRYNADDSEAAERAMLFQWGWFVDPILLGDYPAVMKERLGERLPNITDDDRKLFLEASTDFLGLNYYSSLMASTPEKEAVYSGYWADIHVDFSTKPEWSQNLMGWSVVPDGLREMLLWVHERYESPLIYITENGSCEDEPDVSTAVHDEKRRLYVEEHLRACLQAIQAGVNLAGYFLWSLMDNFEWQFGYQRRFGICYVDFDTLERTPKSSALFYRTTIAARGQNLGIATHPKSQGKRNLDGNSRARHQIPKRVLIGYASYKLEAVRTSIKQGANVIMWSCVDFRASHDNQDLWTEPSRRRLMPRVKNVIPETTLDISAIKVLLHKLDLEGYSNVLHLITVGGWKEWYEGFDSYLGDVFDGIDWDLEGNDDMQSVYNTFTFECLDKMGEISRMAHEDGYVVSMAPPQSYLDIHGSTDFSRAVNLTDRTREWHKDLSCFGRNVYAYLLQKYGPWIDIVSMQFYESYSRAAMAIFADSIDHADYLVSYVEKLAEGNYEFPVHFEQDPKARLDRSNVSLPLSKLVLGFANGWAKDSDNKTVFFTGSKISAAWEKLRAKKLLPRGLMFWIINEEGTNGVNMSHDLGQLLAESFKKP